MTLKPIKAPTDALGAAAIGKVVRNTLNAVALAVKADFGVTTRTWSSKPEFRIEKPDGDTRLVTTDSMIYKFVDEGTRPHLIRPRKGGRLSWMGTAYRAKTKPGVIGSTRGGNNNTIVYTKLVQHPGTEARKLTLAIRDKWAKEMVIRMEKALADAVASNAKPTQSWDWG